MATLFLLVTPCIALIAPLISPAISILAVLALTVMLSVALTALFLWTWNTGDHDENEAVVKDATNIVRTALAALARDPGATSASFRVVNGVVVHRDSTAGVPNGGDGPANRGRSEEVGSRSQDDSRTDGREMNSWSELFHAEGKDSTSPSSGEGRAAVRFRSGA